MEVNAIGAITRSDNNMANGIAGGDDVSSTKQHLARTVLMKSFGGPTLDMNELVKRDSFKEILGGLQIGHEGSTKNAVGSSDIGANELDEAAMYQPKANSPITPYVSTTMSNPNPVSPGPAQQPQQAGIACTVSGSGNGIGAPPRSTPLFASPTMNQGLSISTNVDNVSNFMPPAQTSSHNDVGNIMMLIPGNVSGDYLSPRSPNSACNVTSPGVSAGASSDGESHSYDGKKERRLQKNREAAKECRRKKKEYVQCLKERVQVLERQNYTLIEELRKLRASAAAGTLGTVGTVDVGQMSSSTVPHNPQASERQS